MTDDMLRTFRHMAKHGLNILKLADATNQMSGRKFEGSVEAYRKAVLEARKQLNERETIE